MQINVIALARSLPFLFYIIVMALTGLVPESWLDARWLYGLRIAGTAWLLWWFWAEYLELQVKPILISIEMLLSVFVGLLVFYLWITLHADWMLIGEQTSFDPTINGEPLILFVVMRIIGAALVVPIMEELFWRSFILRWIDQANFLTLRPVAISVKALFISALLFASEHTYWFAGFIAGLLYASLYIRTQNIWYPIIAHAITNFVLGVWIVQTHQWQYW